MGGAHTKKIGRGKKEILKFMKGNGGGGGGRRRGEEAEFYSLEDQIDWVNIYKAVYIYLFLGEKCKKEEEGGCQEDSGGKTTLMELLELEMRARAIKALLKKEEEEEGDEDVLPDPSEHPAASEGVIEEDGIQDIEIELGISSDDDDPSGT